MILENNDIVSFPALFHCCPIILGRKSPGVKETFLGHDTEPVVVTFLLCFDNMYDSPCLPEETELEFSN